VLNKRKTATSKEQAYERGKQNHSFSQGSVEASQEDKKKRKSTGKGKTGRREEKEEEEEVFGASKKTARLQEVEKKAGKWKRYWKSWSK
jgi:ATP-dependent Zn protease